MKPLPTVAAIALVVAPAPAEVITAIKSYRKAEIPPLPPGDLLRAEDGTLYGIGSHWLYRWHPDGSGFTILKQLPVTGGEVPFSGHLALSGSTLYGARSTSGRLGGDLMTVFRINTDGTGYSILRDGISIPPSAVAPGIVLSGDTLYGWGFKIHTDGTGYAELTSFPYRDPELGPEWHLEIVVSGNQIFGTTSSGGHATVFRLNTDDTDYSVLVDLPSGANFNWSLTLVGDTLYTSQFKVKADGTGYTPGTFLFGDVYYEGRFYGSGPPLSSRNMEGTGYTVLKNFTESTNPPAVGYGYYHVNILTVAADTIYGVAQSLRGFADGEGLDGRGGALFKVNTDGSGFSVLHEFTVAYPYPDGNAPGPLAESAGELCGLDSFPGVGARLFKIDADGTSFTAVAVPERFPIIPFRPPTVSGSTVFWTGEGRFLENGDQSVGSIVRMNADGTGLSVLKEFIWSPDEETGPIAPLVVSGDTLYGTIHRGGDPDGSGSDPDTGKIFKLNTDGTGYEVLHQFSPNIFDDSIEAWTNSDGDLVWDEELLLSGTTLYGTAIRAGRFGGGTVFKLNTDGSGFTVLKHFTRQETIDLVFPTLSPLLSLSGDTLYGSWGNAEASGILDSGAVFKLNTDGTGFSVLKQFDPLVSDDEAGSYTNSDGAFPVIGPVIGGSLYGTTSWGGRFGLGTVFKMNSDGTGFAVIAHFGDSDLPVGTDTHVPTRLVRFADSLFVSAPYGGTGGGGAIFRIDLEPTLSIRRTGPDSLEVTWPSAWKDHVLQQSAGGLSPLNWQIVTEPIQDDGTTRTLNVTPTGASRFYRLAQPLPRQVD